MVNIPFVKRAFDELWYSYEPIGVSQHALIYRSPSGMSHVFIAAVSPYISQSSARLSKDKWYTASLFAGKVHLPKTLWFYDPEWTGEGRKSMDEIILDIERDLQYPVMVKQCKWSLWRHIYKCGDAQQVKDALHKIYTRDRHYDHIALVQEYIAIAHEYRVVLLDNEVQFVYEKDISEAKFIGNHSPLHHEWARAVLIHDKDILSQIGQFVQTLTDFFSLSYNWLDVVQDVHGVYRLIELNSSPWFAKYARDNGDEEVVKMYKKMIQRLP
jgi:glutathione synthase/RimK-type ligase-like ATP-grasp enzyme